MKKRDTGNYWGLGSVAFVIDVVVLVFVGWYFWVHPIFDYFATELTTLEKLMGGLLILLLAIAIFLGSTYAKQRFAQVGKYLAILLLFVVATAMLAQLMSIIFSWF